MSPSAKDFVTGIGESSSNNGSFGCSWPGCERRDKEGNPKKPFLTVQKGVNHVLSVHMRTSENCWWCYRCNLHFHKEEQMSKQRITSHFKAHTSEGGNAECNNCEAIWALRQGTLAMTHGRPGYCPASGRSGLQLRGRTWNGQTRKFDYEGEVPENVLFPSDDQPDHNNRLSGSSSAHHASGNDRNLPPVLTSASEPYLPHNLAHARNVGHPHPTSSSFSPNSVLRYPLPPPRAPDLQSAESKHRDDHNARERLSRMAEDLRAGQSGRSTFPARDHPSSSRDQQMSLSKSAARLSHRQSFIYGRSFKA